MEATTVKVSFIIPMRWEMKFQKKKKNFFGAIGNEENQQNVDVFTLANVQKYILAQWVENTVKKK